MANLASSVFSRKPDESVVVEDVYKKVQAVTVNSYQNNLFTSQDLKFDFNFASANSAASNIKDKLSAAKNQFTSVNDQINKGINSGTSKVKSLIKDTQSFVQDYNPITGARNLANKIQYTYNGINYDVATNKLGEVKSTLDALNSFCGDVDYLMKSDGALSNILSSLLNNASLQGITNAFPAAALCGLSSLGVNDKYKVTNNIVLNILPTSLKSGDVETIASISDFTNNGHSSAIVPNAIKEVSKNETKHNDYDFDWYKNTYSKIDPNWRLSPYKTVGSNYTYYDLSKLMEASDLIRGKFIKGAKGSSIDEDKIFSGLEIFDSTITVDGEINNRYPYSPIGKSKNIMGKDIHPSIW